MPTTRYVKIKKAPIKRAIIDRYVAYIQTDVLPRLEAYLEELYEATFEGWNGGNDSGRGPEFDEPQVSIKSRVKVSRSGIITIVIHSVAVENNQPHLLYFWLDFGTKNYTHTTRSATFPVRSRKRWKSGAGLKRGPKLSSGEIYTGEWRHIPAGKTRRGIYPSNITEIIARHFHEEVRQRIYPMVYKGFRRIDLDGKQQ